MKIIVISGFLGAGKTTVLLQLARHLQQQPASDGRVRLAIIENEVGEVSVDDQMLGGYQVTSLFAGCVCCTLVGEMTSAIQKLRDDLDPEYVIIEPTGVASAESILAPIQRYLGIEGRVLGIVDAQRWPKIKRALAQLLDSQLGPADVILVSKVDLVDAAQADEVCADVREHNAAAPLFRVNASQPLPAEVLALIFGEQEA